MCSDIYLKIKKTIPVGLKKIPWFLFKSPQRKLGYQTLWIDLKGFLIYIFHSVYFYLFDPELVPVSICTGLKNRSSNFIDFFLKSLNEIENKELIELSVFDFGSDDVHDLESEIRKNWKGRLIFSSYNKEFSRSYSFNRAIEQCSHSIIFACDADMSLPVDFVKKCNRIVFSKIVWFPVSFHLYNGFTTGYANKNGKWNRNGHGMFASKKTDFIRIGMYDESYTNWGGEDIDLWLRFYKYGYFPYRKKQKGLLHHYHESLKPEGFNAFK